MADRQQIDLQNELELRLTASLLRTPDWIGEAAALLREDDFETVDAADLFKALCRLFLDGRPVTAVAAAVEAGDQYNDLLHSLMRSTLGAETHDEFAFLCESLQSRSRLRKVQALAFRLAQTAEPELAAHLVDEINGAMSRRRETRAVSLQDAMADFFARMEEKPVYLPWGMPRLDEELYAELGDFVILGGQPSSGKTMLALQFAFLMAQSYKVGFFSLETSDRKLVDRIVAAKAPVRLRQIKRRDLSAEDWARIADAAGPMDKLDLTLLDASGMSASDIQAVTLQHRFQVIFVDHIQIVHSTERDLRVKVTQTSIALHELAQSHGIAVIGLAQLSRPEKPKSGKPTPPSMHSLKETGQLEQDADVIMLLYPKDPDDNHSNRMLKVAKNKEGDRLRIELAFSGATQTFTPVAEEAKIRQRLINEGRKAKNQTVMPGFTDITDEKEELPF